MKQTVIETPSYLAQAAALGLNAEERAAIIDVFADDPEAGDVMQGTGGARKTRFAGRGKGKSGGYRVISFYGAADVPVFLLGVFGKGDKTNLSKAECNALAKILGQIVDAYRMGVSASLKKGAS